MKMILFALVGLIATGCTPKPDPFVFGSDQDSYCRMTISEPQFAAQIVLKTGKVYKFDSIECMANFMAAGTVAADVIDQVWVSDYAMGGGLIPAGDARFLKSSLMRSPMGGGLAAFGPSIASTAIVDSFGGQLMTWDEVRTLASTTH